MDDFWVAFVSSPYTELSCKNEFDLHVTKGNTFPVSLNITQVSLNITQVSLNITQVGLNIAQVSLNNANASLVTFSVQ